MKTLARHSGLRARAVAKQRTTIDRVQAAIALLNARGARVSLLSIVAASAELSPNEPLASSTICRNPAARSLYEAARTSRITRCRHPRARDSRLERKSKAELVDLIHHLRGKIEQLERCLDANAFR